MATGSFISHNYSSSQSEVLRDHYKLSYRKRAGDTIRSKPHQGCGHGSRVVKVSDRGWPCHMFERSTTKDMPCRAAMLVKSIESSNVLLLVRWSS
ncbi:hypothetical protein TNCV_4698781 [Trichonephila clavipes]|nr:hypothetical protein TNCV_4698781 [Trichonephila clavipes]